MIGFADRYFQITARKSTVSNEIIAGIVTFLSMVYILAVQPQIMRAAQMDPGRVFTATALSAGIATLIMAIIGRLPIALASGLGMNTYIAFTVCGAMGYPWQVALTSVLLEGVVFTIFTLTGLRQMVIKAVPEVVKKAVAAGIGLFIAIVGLQLGGILVVGGATPLGMNPITSGAPLVTIIGLIVLIILYVMRIPGSILIAIIVATLVSIPLGVMTVPNDFSFYAAPPVPYFLEFDFSHFFSKEFFFVFLSLFLVDFFDTLSTLAAVAYGGNLLDSNGDVINCKQALFSDALSTIVGSLFGATTVTSYIESSAGVSLGGRTGLASIVTGILFLCALVLSPIFLLIPGAATAPALIFAGALMLNALTGLNFANIEVAFPLFITLLAIPMSYSISTGLAWGFVAYALMKFATGKLQDFTPLSLVLVVIFIVKIVWIKV